MGKSGEREREWRIIKISSLQLLIEFVSLCLKFMLGMSLFKSVRVHLLLAVALLLVWFN